jgi:ferric-dicitrate binding protein FerR (iron transport regulator)
MRFFRSVVCILLAFIPGSLSATETGAAVLYVKGTAWLNGSAVPGSSAIFSGDLVQTQSGSAANINAVGANVIVSPDSVVRFESTHVGLERGAVTVATSNGMAVHVGSVTVTPATSTWTQFEVAQADNGVRIIARKGDVSVADGTGSSNLPEGQQTTREDQEKKKRKKKGAAAPVAGGAGPLSSPWAEAGGAAAVGVILIWALKPGPEPVSPWKP